MGTGYTRNDTANNIADGNIINAADLDGEFDAVEAAFNSSTGHTHDGTAAEGGAITVLGPSQEFVASATEVKPSTNAGLSLGTSLLQFNDLYIDGTANIDTLAGASVTADLNFTDNTKAVFGAGSDLQIYHDGSNSIIKDAGTGNLKILGTSMNIQSATEENYIEAVANSHVKLFYDAAEKLATTSTGISVTGNATFADNGKAIFGAGSDLSIYHSSLTNNSVIQETGSGNLLIYASNISMADAGGNEFILMTDTGTGGTVELKHNTSTKLTTESGGVNITGTLTSDGLTVDGDGSFTGDFEISGLSPKIFLNETDTTDVNTRIRNAGGNLQIQTVSDTDASPVTRFAVDHSTGDISFYEDTGTTAKFFWDASAESLGIGTTSPSSYSSSANNLVVQDTAGEGGITIVSTNAGSSNIFFADTDAAAQGQIKYQHSGDYMRFYTAASERMRITSGGTLQIAGGGNDNVGEINMGNTAQNANRFQVRHQSSAWYLKTVDSEPLVFGTSNTERMRITSSGSVGIGTSSPSAKIEAVGATALQLRNAATDGFKFVQQNTNSWAFDALTSGSNFSILDSNVGIGTSSPEETLSVMGDFQVALNTSVTGRGLKVSTSNTSITDDTVAMNAQASTGILAFQTNSTERMRIDSSGNVGIGVTPNTTNYGDWLFIGSAGNSIFGASNDMNMTANAYYNSNWTYGTSTAASRYQQTSGQHIWSYAASGTAGNTISFNEAMRIDSSGNLLVGKTNTDRQTDGHEQRSDGFARHTRDGNNPLELVRRSNDGDIAKFYKDGSMVGSIGTQNGQPYFAHDNGSSDVGILLGNSGTTARAIIPCRDGGTIPDGAIDIGYSSGRWRDLYLSGGVYLGGTGSANKLDDYEEGTWTPIDGSGAGLTFVGSGGRFVRIGTVVNFAFRAHYPSTTDTSSAAISGLPFTGAATTGSFDAAGGWTSMLSQNFSTAYLGYVVVSSTNLKIISQSNASTTLTNANVSGNNIYGFGTYYIP